MKKSLILLALPALLLGGCSGDTVVTEEDAERAADAIANHERVEVKAASISISSRSKYGDKSSSGTAKVEFDLEKSYAHSKSTSEGLTSEAWAYKKDEKAYSVSYYKGSDGQEVKTYYEFDAEESTSILDGYIQGILAGIVRYRDYSISSQDIKEAVAEAQAEGMELKFYSNEEGHLRMEMSGSFENEYSKGSGKEVVEFKNYLLSYLKTDSTGKSKQKDGSWLSVERYQEVEASYSSVSPSYPSLSGYTKLKLN